MTKVTALKKLFKKITGTDSSESTTAAILDELADKLTSVIGGKLVKYQSNFITTDETTEIPINITGFDKEQDILFVYINGLKANEDTAYTISADSSKIILTDSILAGQSIEFVVMKNE